MPKVRKAVEVVDLTTPPRKRIRHDFESSQKSLYYPAYLPSSSLDSASSSRSARPTFATRTPMDTPSNPLGLRHRQLMSYSLPEPSSYTDHIPLRFQLIQCPTPYSVRNSERSNSLTPQHAPKPGEKVPVNSAITIRHDREGVNRVVQVPRNYSFLHLRRLIMFLFGGIDGEPIDSFPEDEQDIVAPKTYQKAKGDTEPYVFEVFRNIDLYPLKARPGEIRAGELWTKLSNAKEARYVQESQSTDTEEEIDDFFRGSTALRKVLSGTNGPASSSPESDTEVCAWKSEDELDLFAVWPKRCNYLSRGIVYRHNATTQVHISVPQEPIVRRKCLDNVPHVFKARGLVRLHGVNPKNLGTLCYNPELDEDSAFDRFNEDLTCAVSPERYNALHEFETFYRRAAQLEGCDLPRSVAGGAWDTPASLLDDVPSTPSLTFGSSSPASAYPYTPSTARSLRIGKFTEPRSSLQSLSSLMSSPPTSPSVQVKKNLLARTPFTQPTPQTHHRMQRIEKLLIRDARELSVKMREAALRMARREAEKQKQQEEKAKAAASAVQTKRAPLPPLIPAMQLAPDEADTESETEDEDEVEEQVDQLSEDVEIAQERASESAEDDAQSDEDTDEDELIDELTENEIAEAVVKRALFPEAFNAPAPQVRSSTTQQPAIHRKESAPARGIVPKPAKPPKIFPRRDELNLPSLAPAPSPDPIWIKDDISGEWQRL